MDSYKEEITRDHSNRYTKDLIASDDKVNNDEIYKAYALLYEINNFKHYEGLRKINDLLHHGLNVDEIPAEHINKIVGFIAEGDETEKQCSLMIFSLVFSMSDDSFEKRTKHEYISAITDIIDNTENDETFFLALKCIDSFIKMKPKFIDYQEKEMLFIQAEHGLESIGSRFIESTKENNIVSTAFSVAAGVFSLFGKEMCDAYLEDNESFEDTKTIEEIISLCQAFISKYPIPAIQFLITFCREANPLFDNFVCNSVFLEQVFSLCYTISADVDQQVFQLVDCILTFDHSASMFILSSSLVKSLDVADRYENDVLVDIMRTLYKLITCFIELFYSYSEQSQTEACYECISETFPPIIEAAAYMFQNSNYDLKREACLLICKMMEVGAPSSYVIIDNFDDIIPCLADMLQGEDSELDRAIIRCIILVVDTADKKMEEENADGREYVNKFIEEICDDPLSEKIDELEEIYTDNEKLTKVIKVFKQKVDIYRETAEFE